MHNPGSSLNQPLQMTSLYKAIHSLLSAKAVLLCCLLVCLISMQGLAQNTLSGKIVEEGTGEALSFATVIVKGSSTGAVANVDGFFSLLNLPEDSITLEVRYVGYTSRVLRAKAGEGLLLISLQAQGQLDEVVVSAESYKVFNASAGISATTLSTKQLSLLPAVGEPDIFRSLQLLPGVSSTSESSSGLFIRGGTPDQNLTLLDGMTVYKVDHFFGFFSAFNTRAIKDVRLYRGAFPARYGGRTSGVVELTGKTGSFEKAQGGLSMSLLSLGGYLELPLGDKVSLMLAGRRSYTEIIKSGLYQDLLGNLSNDNNLAGTPLEGATNISTEPVFYFYDLNAKLSWRPSEKDMLTLSTYHGKDYLDESQDFSRFLTPELLLNYQLAEETDWGNTGLSARWSRQWNPRFYSNVLLATSDYFSNYDRDEYLGLSREDSILIDGSRQTLEDNGVKDISARADFEWQVHARSKVEFGYSFTHNQIDYQSVRNDTVVLLQRDQEASYSAFYLSNESTIGKLTLVAGLRLSDYSYTDDLLIEPRANLSFRLSPKIKLKAAYGRHYQFANQIVNQNLSEGSREFWLLADGDLIGLSSATHYVAGMSYEVDGWLADVEVYHKDLEGLNEFSLQFSRGINDGVEELFRQGSGLARGAEFLLQKKQGRYTGWISYTLSDIRHDFPELNEGFPFRPLHYQRHEFKTVHSVEVDTWNFSLNFIYGSGKPFSEPANRYEVSLPDGRILQYVGVGPKNASYNPAYIRLDLSAHYGFKWGKADADLGLSLFNMLGRKNIWYTEYNFSQEPPIVNQINYLGFTPNLLFSIDF